MDTQTEHVTPLGEVLSAYEKLGALPPPSLDLTQETRALDSLLDAGHELAAIDPTLLPLVCQMVLRELGRFPESRREDLMFETLAITPPEDETVLRILVERVPPIKVVKWLLENPGPSSRHTLKRLERLFRCVPPHAFEELLNGLVKLPEGQRELVTQALAVVGTRIVHLLRPVCESASPAEAAQLLEKLTLVADKSVGPLVSQLLRRIDSENLVLIEAAIKTLGATGDRAFVASIETHLDHPSPTIRTAAAAALGTLGGAIAFERLERQIKQKHLGLEERKAALAALAALDTEEAWRVLRKFARPSIFGGFPEALRAHAEALLEERNAQSMYTRKS